MNIKNSFARLSSTILALVLGGALLRAQSSASTNQSETNIITVPANSSATNTNTLSVTNFSAAAGSKHKHKSPPPLSSQSSNFWNDKAGIRAGGSPSMGVNWENGRIGPSVPIFGKTIVALAAILSPFILAFGLPAVIIFTVFYFRHRQSKMMHETVRAMIEKGVPVSPEMIAGLNANGLKVNIQGKLDQGKSRNRYLLPGLILVGAGLALIFTLPEHSGPGGLIILFIGLAFLIVWLVERRENRNDDRGTNMPNVGVQQTESKKDNAQQPPKM